MKFITHIKNSTTIKNTILNFSQWFSLGCLVFTSMDASSTTSKQTNKTTYNHSTVKKSTKSTKTTSTVRTSISPSASKVILNLSTIAKSNVVSQAVNNKLYQQYQKINEYIDSHPTLALEEKNELTSMLQGIKTYVLYPVILAKVISTYPNDFDFSDFMLFYSRRFANSNYIQNMLLSTWTNDLANNNYQRIVKQAQYFPKLTITTSQCAVEIARINLRVNLASTLVFNKVLNGNVKISPICLEFVNLYASHYKLDSKNKTAVSNYIVKAFSNNSLDYLSNVSSIIKPYRDLTDLYQYAQRFIANPKLVFTKARVGGYYGQINIKDIDLFVNSVTYKNKNDVYNFIRYVRSTKVSSYFKDLTIKTYLVKNFFKIPSEITDNLLKIYKSPTALQHKIRLKIRYNEPYLTYIKLLPTNLRNQPEWRYWYARAIERSAPNTAKSIYRSLTSSYSFFGLLASKRLNTQYWYIYKLKKPLAPAFSLEKHASWYANAIIEANNQHDTKLALSLWSDINVYNQYTGLIQWAYNHQLYYLGVNKSITQGLWTNFTARFPNAYSSLFNYYASQNTVTKTFAQAIARQESSWNYNIVSPANAYGLMQFINSTGARVARQLGINYTGYKTLLDPRTAIQLGVFHLSDIMNNYSNNRAFAAIGYNAGAGRINQWINRPTGKLDFDQFIESIPFKETRHYVMNTIMYDYINQVLQGFKSPIAFYSEEWNRKY